MSELYQCGPIPPIGDGAWAKAERERLEAELADARHLLLCANLHIGQWISNHREIAEHLAKAGITCQCEGYPCPVRAD